jgi:hypothetical protein
MHKASCANAQVHTLFGEQLVKFIALTARRQDAAATAHGLLLGFPEPRRFEGGLPLMKPESEDKSESIKSLTLVIKRARTRVSSGLRTGICYGTANATTCAASDPTVGGAGACASRGGAGGY